MGFSEFVNVFASYPAFHHFDLFSVILGECKPFFFLFLGSCLNKKSLDFPMFHYCFLFPVI